jgi:hypothetical protein
VNLGYFGFSSDQAWWFAFVYVFVVGMVIQGLFSGSCKCLEVIVIPGCMIFWSRTKYQDARASVIGQTKLVYVSTDSITCLLHSPSRDDSSGQ